MSEFVQVMTMKDYFNKYAIEGLVKNGASKTAVKEQLLDAFRRETFNTASIMVGSQVFNDKYEASDKDKQKLNNILKNTNKKWKSLVKEFAKFKETCGFLTEDDFMKYMNDRTEYLTKANNTEYVSDEDIAKEETKDGSDEAR